LEKAVVIAVITTEHLWVLWNTQENIMLKKYKNKKENTKHEHL